MSSRTRSRSAGGRRGATVVELALILIPLLALVFSIFDFAFVLFLKSTFQHAVREGTRYAVTSRTLSGTGHDASIKAVVQQNAMGYLNGDGEAKIHIRYYVPGTLTETQSNMGGNIVEVSVEGYEWRWMAPLLRSAMPSLTIQARSSDRMEPSPGGTPPAR